LGCAAHGVAREERLLTRAGLSPGARAGPADRANWRSTMAKGTTPPKLPTTPIKNLPQIPVKTVPTKKGA
jgi:hypothetical protein